MKKVFFYKNYFFVEKGVFLPRFETEQLVDFVNFYSKNFQTEKIKLLELGIGSGVISCSLGSYNSKWEIQGIEINPKALNLANKNKINLNLNNVSFYLGDMFENILPYQKFDMIVANLPYIGQNEKYDLEILKWDPKNALFSGNDGLNHFKIFFKNAKKHLAIKHLIALEIGQNQKHDLEILVKKYFPDSFYFFKKDYNQLIRYLFIFNFKIN